MAPRVQVRVSRGARRGVFDKSFEMISSSGGLSILNNRRIDRYCVSSFEYRYPQQVSMRERQSLHVGAFTVKASGRRPEGKRPDNKRTNRKRRPNKDKRSKQASGRTEGQVARQQQGQEAQIAQAAHQISQEATERRRAWSHGIEMEKDQRSHDSGNSTCRLEGGMSCSINTSKWSMLEKDILLCKG